ncbi:hypothetical protein [Nocardia asiatica]
MLCSDSGFGHAVQNVPGGPPPERAAAIAAPHYPRTVLSGLAAGTRCPR